MKNNYHWKDAGFKNKIMAAVIHFHLWPFFLWLYISYLVRKSSPQRQANGSLPSACIMAVCVRNVAASRYIRRHIGQGRGSWKANLRGGSPPRGSKPVNERTIASKWLSGRGGDFYFKTYWDWRYRLLLTWKSTLYQVGSTDPFEWPEWYCRCCW